MMKRNLCFFGTLCFLLGTILSSCSKANKSTSVEQTKPNLLEESIAELATEVAVSEMLDRGKIDDAKHVLRIQQDGRILLLNQLVGTNRNQLVDKMFTRISAHRRDYPFHYAGGLTMLDTNAAFQVEKILARYK